MPKPKPIVLLEDVSFWYTVAEREDEEREDEGQDGLQQGEHKEEVQGFSPLDCAIQPGEAVLFCGKSGSGKSSILRAINGLIPHFHDGTIEGTITAAGHNPTTAPLHETGRNIAMVFQSPKNQFFALEVQDELAFGMENAGVPPEEIIARMTDIVAQYQLEHLVGHDVLALSGGQQQLVACASVHMDSPDVVLFDEPASNLHPSMIERLKERLLALKNEGITLLIAEHRLAYLKDIVDKVVYVSADGNHVQQSAAEFYALSNEHRQTMGLRAIGYVDLPDVPMRHVQQGNNAATTQTVQSATTQTVQSATTQTVQSASSATMADSFGVLLSDVTFAYGKKQVLNIKYLGIPKGKVIGLVGANGAGKSTLAAAICGLIRTKGTIAINGINRKPRQRTKHCYLVMQDVHRQLFAPSVLAELRLNNPTLTDQEGLALLATIGLQDFADRHPLSLSGGQKQRLVVLAAQVANKDVFIFDEPSSGLDLEHLQTISSIMKTQAAKGKTVMVISHDHELLSACADSLIMLHPYQ